MGTREWLGYLVAMVISGMVLLLFYQSNRRAQASSIAATQVRASRMSAFNLAHMLQRDLRNMGGNHPCDLSVKPYPVDLNSVIPAPPQTGSGAGSFQFISQAERCQVPVMVRYEWSQEGEVALLRGVVPVYSVRRLVNGTLSGMTGPTISKIEFELLGDNGLSVPLTDVRQIAVEVRSVSPLGESDLMEESLWNAVIHPLAMTFQDWGVSDS